MFFVEYIDITVGSPNYLVKSSEIWSERTLNEELSRTVPEVKILSIHISQPDED